MDFDEAAHGAYGYFEQALEKTRKRDYRGAEKCIKDGLDLYPNSARLHNMMGNNLRRKTDHHDDKKALTHLAKACRLDPKSIRFCVDHAGLQAKIAHRENDADTLRIAQKTLLSVYKPEGELVSTSIYALTGIGSFYLLVGNADFTAQCFGKCLELNPGDKLALRRLDEMKTAHGCVPSEEGWQAFLTHRTEFLKDYANLYYGPTPLIGQAPVLEGQK